MLRRSLGWVFGVIIVAHKCQNVTTIWNANANLLLPAESESVFVAQDESKFWRQLGSAEVVKEGHLQSDMTLNPNMIQHLKLSRSDGI